MSTAGGARELAASTVTVQASARLHFGMLDLRGDLGRRFGGMGAAVPAPTSSTCRATWATGTPCKPD